MAGNIVKWWKHKIFGGYKQFSVLQECTTDSEELMYHQVRAPSTCSAPPDLLLVSDIENIVPIKSSTQITNNQTTTRISSTEQQQEQSLSQNHHHYQHQHSNSKIKYKNNSPLVEISNDTVPTTTTAFDATGPTSSINAKPSKHTKNCFADKEGGENSQEEKMHLEEFTCDVSVENGKSSQPLQFSFTFYDLDGHHGKITKDDIVGIVYTIYESIGKSVVVPHCGSKTINVRLTVSPEGKSKSNNNCKLKKSTVISKLNCEQKINNNNNNNNHDMNVINHHQHKYHHHSHIRRQHRYRPRKLIKTDDEEDDTASEKDQKVKTNFYNKKYGQNKNSIINNCQSIPGSSKNYNENENITVQTSGIGSSILNNCKNGENIFNNKNDDQNIKINSITRNDKTLEIEECQECAAAKTSKEQYDHAQQFLKRAKILRKSRKHKEQVYESRQRSQSMSACNDWKKRFNEKKLKMNSTQNTPIHQQNDFKQQQDSQQQQLQQNNGNQDIVDGIVSSTTTTPTQKSWNNALKRNELIDIIRESMEKNRLCFQSNGKSQTNMSPVRHHRQRSNTVSKITTDLKKSNPINYNHLYGNPQSNHKQLINTNNITDITGDGIHVPIYHQQFLTNIQQQQKQIPIDKGFKNHKVNLCGYDSFLHATICGGSNRHVYHHNNVPLNSMNVQNSINQNLVPKIIQQQQQQQQPTLDFFINHQQNISSPKIYINNSNIIKTNKHLRQQNNGISGDNQQQQQQQQQNSPPFYGYQRLNSSTTTCNLTNNNLTTKLNQTLLKTINPELNLHEEQLDHTIYHVEKWLNDNNDKTNNKINDIKLMKQIYHNTIDKNIDEINKLNKKDVKNYDNLLYSKLNDKLITTNPQTTHNKYNNPIKYNLNNKENIRKIKNHQKQYHEKLLKQQYRKNDNKNSMQQQQTSTANVSNNKFDDNLIPIFVNDPVECENLIPLITSDEESTTPSNISSSNNKCKNDNNKDKRNSSSSSSSTIHRYVHEHIHHHYHHFENKDED